MAAIVPQENFVHLDVGGFEDLFGCLLCGVVVIDQGLHTSKAHSGDIPEVSTPTQPAIETVVINPDGQ